MLAASKEKKVYSLTLKANAVFNTLEELLVYSVVQI